MTTVTSAIPVPVEWMRRSLGGHWRIKFAPMRTIRAVSEPVVLQIAAAAREDGALTYDSADIIRFDPAHPDNDYGRLAPDIVAYAIDIEQRLGTPMDTIEEQVLVTRNKPGTVYVHRVDRAALEHLAESAEEMARLRAGQPDEKQWREIAGRRREQLEEASA